MTRLTNGHIAFNRILFAFIIKERVRLQPRLLFSEFLPNRSLPLSMLSLKTLILVIGLITVNAQYSEYYYTPYPPLKLSAGRSFVNVSTGSYGLGHFSYSSSSFSGIRNVSTIYDGLFNTFWMSSALYSSSGSYNGDVSTQTSDGRSLGGEWIQLTTPRPIIVSTYSLFGVSNQDTSPLAFELFCSNITDSTSSVIWFSRSVVSNYASSRAVIPYNSKLMPLYCNAFRLVFPSIKIAKPGKTAYSMLVSEFFVTAANGRSLSSCYNLLIPS